MHKDMEERQSAHERFPEKDPTLVSQVADDMITINGRRYRLIQDYKDAMHKDRLAERYEQVLDKYDYIVGDWGFEQLRLKGFYDDKRRQAAPDQKIGHLQDYIYEYCNFGCAYFVLERIDAPEPVEEPHHRRPARPRSQQHQSTNRRSESGNSETKHERNGENRPHHSRRGRRGGRHQRDHKPYTEKNVTEKRPERGQHQEAKDSGSKTNRHFNIRTIDDTNK